jgi:hypothetical protein
VQIFLAWAAKVNRDAPALLQEGRVKPLLHGDGLSTTEDTLLDKLVAAPLNLFRLAASILVNLPFNVVCGGARGVLNTVATRVAC